MFTFEENLQFSLMCLEFPFAHSASLFVFELCPSLIARHSLAPSTSVGQPCVALEVALAEECVVLVEVTLAEEYVEAWIQMQQMQQICQIPNKM